MSTMKENPLGKKHVYPKQYSPDLLFAIPRSENRKKLENLDEGQFKGFDLWHAYEFSWLSKNNVPAVALLAIDINCDSINMVESKSLKLYLNSFAFTKFESEDGLLDLIYKDLRECVQGDLTLTLEQPDKHSGRYEIDKFEKTYPDARCIDGLVPKASIQFAAVDKGLLQTNTNVLTQPQLFYTHLFRSLCPVTAQPDWASLFIHYQGREIKAESLLAYVLSFREHQGFHEACVERIFTELVEQCQPEKLSVYAAFTRRGGIEINPFRSNFEKCLSVGRQLRQ